MIAGILELVPIIGPIIAAVPAVLLAATAGVEAVVAALVAVHARPAGREQRPRAEDPGRCGRVASCRRDLRDHHRRRAGRAARGDPGPAHRRGHPRRRALPVPAPQPGGARGSGTRRSRLGCATGGPEDRRPGAPMDPAVPDSSDAVQDAAGRSRGGGRGHQGGLSAARPQVPPGRRADCRTRPTRMAAINAAFELIGDPGARTVTTRDAGAARGTGGSAPTDVARRTRCRRHRSTARRHATRDRCRATGRQGRSSVGGGYDARCDAPDGPARQVHRRGARRAAS